MEKAEYQDHPEKLMGWQEFKGHGQRRGTAYPAQVVTAKEGPTINKAGA